MVGSKSIQHILRQVIFQSVPFFEALTKTWIRSRGRRRVAPVAPLKRSRTQGKKFHCTIYSTRRVKVPYRYWMTTRWQCWSVEIRKAAFYCLVQYPHFVVYKRRKPLNRHQQFHVCRIPSWHTRFLEQIVLYVIVKNIIINIAVQNTSLLQLPGSRARRLCLNISSFSWPGTVYGN